MQRHADVCVDATAPFKALWALSLVLLHLKLSGAAALSWWAVTAPLWAPPAAALALAATMAFLSALAALVTGED